MTTASACADHCLPSSGPDVHEKTMPAPIVLNMPFWNDRATSNPAPRQGRLPSAGLESSGAHPRSREGSAAAWHWRVCAVRFGGVMRLIMMSGSIEQWLRASALLWAPEASAMALHLFF